MRTLIGNTHDWEAPSLNAKYSGEVKGRDVGAMLPALKFCSSTHEAYVIKEP